MSKCLMVEKRLEIKAALKSGLYFGASVGIVSKDRNTVSKGIK